MADFILTLDIQTTGDKIAVAKVEAVTAATEKAGKTHEKTAKKADDHKLALGKLGRALENYAEEVLGANHVVAEFGNTLGDFALGAAPMVAILGGLFAITKAYDVIAEHAKKAREEQAKLADEFDRIAHLSVIEQGAEAQKLYGGDPFAAKVDEKGQLTLARFSLAELERQKAQFDRERRQFITGAGEGGGMAYVSRVSKESEEQFKRVNAEIERRKALLQSILGGGGTMGLAGQLAAQLDMTKGDGTNTPGGKLGDDLAKAAAQAFGLGIKRRQDQFKQSVNDMVAQIIENDQYRQSVVHELVPTKEEIDQAVREAGDAVVEAMKHDPVLIKGQMVKDMGEQLGHMLGDGIASTMVQGLDAGFEDAFSGSGAVGFIEGFGKAVLGALGGVMEQMGAALISYGIAMELVAVGLSNPFTSGPAAIAAGTLLVALGAALSAAVRGGSGHVSGGGYSAASGLPQIIDRGIINPDSYSSRSAHAIPERAMVVNHNTFYGANDPQAVRWFDEIQRKSNQRGSLAGATA